MFLNLPDAPALERYGSRRKTGSQNPEIYRTVNRIGFSIDPDGVKVIVKWGEKTEKITLILLLNYG